jgi:hypothetical protein
MAVATDVGKQKKRFKWRRNIAIAFVLYTLVGFFVLPAIIKSQMLKRLPALTHRVVSVQQVKINPYAFSFTIRGFALKETNGDVFTSFDQFYIRFKPLSSLFHWAAVFKEISIARPFAQATHNADGTFNFANLLPTNAPPPPSTNPPGPLPRVIIEHFSVTNGGAAFADLDRPETFKTAFTPINLDLTNLTTIRDRNSPYAFIARTGEGETFAWEGWITVNPLGSAGKFRLGGISLKKYMPYSHDYARYEIADGSVDVAADYLYDSRTNALDLSVSNLVVHLNQLALKSPDTGETVVAIPTLVVSDTEASVARQTARVGLIKSSGGSLLVRQEADGSVNLLSLLKLPTNTPASAPTATNSVPALPWVAHIDEIAFDNYSFKIEDKKPSQPASFDIDQLGFDVKGVSNLTNAPVTASLLLRFAKTGFVAVDGTATLMPPSADLQINLTNVDLRPLQPYVHAQARLAITGGAVDLHGHARYAPPEAGAPMATFTGNLAVNKFDTADDVLFKDFLKWDALDVDGINLEVLPNKLHVDQVKFAGLETSLIVGPDRRANLQTILQDQLGGTNTGTNAAGPAPTAIASDAPPAARPPLPDISLGALVLENAAIHFADQSLEPHAGFDVQEFGGTISGLSSDEKSTATVNFNGKVDARSPFTVTGKLNPLATNMYVDIAVAFTNTELTPFSPYTGKYAGRPLEKGKLSFAVHYDINGKSLKAENSFYIDQLTLGPKNDSPDATKLPVKLAVELLQDRNGRISLDVPLSGRIDDPKFRVFPIIMGVVGNIMVKAATSPFSLLGALVGGNGDELSFVAFEPGQIAIPNSETNKLEKLQSALYQRPALSLEITGSANPPADSYPLAQRKLEDQLKSAWIKEQTDGGKPAVSLEQVKLAPDDFERLLKKKYHTDIGRYEPTPVSTNAIGGATNSLAAQLAALPPITGPEHGAKLLMHGENSPRKPGSNARPSASAATPGAASAASPARPLTRAELELADMEDQLVRRIQVTADDFRDLMQQRANAVQAYLLKSQKVTADRLFIITPKSVDATTPGEDRVNLSLD